MVYNAKIFKISYNLHLFRSLLRKSSSATKTSDKCGNSTKEDKSHVSKVASTCEREALKYRRGTLLSVSLRNCWLFFVFVVFLISWRTFRKGSTSWRSSSTARCSWRMSWSRNAGKELELLLEIIIKIYNRNYPNALISEVASITGNGIKASVWIFWEKLWQS